MIGRNKFEGEKIAGDSTEIERKRVEIKIERGTEEGSWRFRRKEMAFREK